MRRAVLLVLLALLGILTACGDDDGGDSGEGESRQLPLVIVSAGDQSRQVAPLRICDIDVQDCAENPNAAATMPVAPGAPVRIQVSPLISTTPWQVAFRLREAGAAEAIENRTKVFAPKETGDYTLETPPGSQLELIEIQQFGLPSEATGGIEFPIRASWLVNVTPLTGPPAAP